MRTTNDMRNLWGPPCQASEMVLRYLPGGARAYVHRLTFEAWGAFGCIAQAHAYALDPRPEKTGAYNCRKITGGDNFSLHAYGIALDVNPDANPYRRDRLVTDMPAAFLQDVRRVRTRDGVRVFRWGGDWDWDPGTRESVFDAMHFELQASRAEIMVGLDWNTVTLPARDPGRAGTWPVLQERDRGPTVAELQRRLGVVADAVFGPATARAARMFQEARGLKGDAVVGLATWTAVLSQMPALRPNTVPVTPPQKGLIGG